MEGLQKSLDAGTDFFSNWNLNLTYDKTKCITFNKRDNKGKNILKINGNLENVMPYKYLGSHISCKKLTLKLKYFVGLNRSTRNIAVRTEFGRLPFFIKFPCYGMELYKVP